MEDSKQDKRYKSVKKVRNRVDKYKSLRKKKRKGFHGRRKNNSAINNSKPLNSDPASASTNATTTTNTNATTDYNRTPSASTINNKRTNDEVELPDVIDNNKSITEKKQGWELLDDTNLLYPLKTSTRK